MTRRLAIAIVVLLALVMKWPVSGQTSSTGPDVLGALLVEVRGLRAAMEQMAAAGPRVQLAMGRLQLQEQRVNSMLRRLEEVRDRVSGEEQNALRLQQDLSRMQGMSQKVVEAGEREALEHQGSLMKAELERLMTNLQRLRTEHAEIAGNLSAEQGRWMEINQRLEELDRALGRR